PERIVRLGELFQLFPPHLRPSSYEAMITLDSGFMPPITFSRDLLGGASKDEIVSTPFTPELGYIVTQDDVDDIAGPYKQKQWLKHRDYTALTKNDCQQISIATNVESDLIEQAAELHFLIMLAGQTYGSSPVIDKEVDPEEGLHF